MLRDFPFTDGDKDGADADGAPIDATSDLVELQAEEFRHAGQNPDVFHQENRNARGFGDDDLAAFGKLRHAGPDFEVIVPTKALLDDVEHTLVGDDGDVEGRSDAFHREA